MAGELQEEMASAGVVAAQAFRDAELGARGAERRKKGPGADLIPGGICLQGCKSALESEQEERDLTCFSLVRELAVLSVLGTSSPAGQPSSFALWGVSWSLKGFVFLLGSQRLNLKALNGAVQYHCSLKI